MWIINDEKIRALTGNGTTNAHRKVGAPFGGVPPARCLTVGLKPDPLEDLLIVLAVDQVSDLATEVHRQLSSVSGLDDLLVWVAAHEPRRKVDRGKLRLRMSRRHVDDQALALTIRHALKCVSYDFVVPATNKARPHTLHEVKECLLGLLSALSLLQVIQHLEQLTLLLNGKLSDLRKESG